MDNLLSSVKCVFWFSLCILVWYALLLFHDVRSTIQITKDTAIQAQQLSKRVNDFVTVDRLRNLDNGISTQIYATQTLTNSYKQIADVTTKTLENVINPRVKTLTDNTISIQEQTVKTLTSIERLVDDQNRNLTNISHATNDILQNTNRIILLTEPQLLEVLASLAKTSEGLQVLTNDPSLQSNLKQVLQNTTNTTANVQVITKELADLTTYVVEPIVRPKPQTGVKKILTYVVRVVRILSATGNILFLLERVR